MRQKIGFLALVLLVILTGCVGPLSFEAQEPEVNQTALDEESYELNRTETVETERTETVAGEERNITVTSKLKIYEKELGSSDVSSLDSDGINDTVDVGELSSEEILEQLNGELGDYVTAEQVASLDPALTEETVQELLDEGVTVEEILDRSDIEISELITSEELLDKLNESNIEDATEQIGTSSRDEELQVSVYAVFSSPSISIGGTEFNPLLEQEPRETVTQLRDRTSQDFTIENRAETYTLERENGTDTDVTVFNITTEQNGIEVDGELLVTKYRVDNSIVLSVGAYPKILDERDSMEKLIRNTSVKKR